MCSSDVFLALIAVLLPPLPVWIKHGLCSCDSLINILLCLLGYFPGLLHSWYVIFATPDYEEYERIIDVESGRHHHHHHHNPHSHHHGGNVTYYYVEVPRPQHPGYGAMGNTPAQVRTQAPTQNDSQGAGRAVPPSYNEAIQGDNKVQRS